MFDKTVEKVVTLVLSPDRTTLWQTTLAGCDSSRIKSVVEWTEYSKVFAIATKRRKFRGICQTNRIANCFSRPICPCFLPLVLVRV